MCDSRQIACGLSAMSIAMVTRVPGACCMPERLWKPAECTMFTLSGHYNLNGMQEFLETKK